MGQYFHIVNVDSGEYIDPQTVHSGIKAMDIAADVVNNLVLYLLALPAPDETGHRGSWAGDRVVWAGEMGNSEPCLDELTIPEGISGSSMNLYHIAEEIFDEISEPAAREYNQSIQDERYRLTVPDHIQNMMEDDIDGEPAPGHQTGAPLHDHLQDPSGIPCLPGSTGYIIVNTDRDFALDPERVGVPSTLKGTMASNFGSVLQFLASNPLSGFDTTMSPGGNWVCDPVAVINPEKGWVLEEDVDYTDITTGAVQSYHSGVTDDPMYRVGLGS